MRLSLRAGAVLAAAAASAPAFDSEVTETRGIPWGEVYQRNSVLPPGCRCLESFVAFDACAKYDCECTCDITAGKCDYGCCCDAECTAAQKERFEARGSCFVPPSDTRVAKCYGREELAEINLRYPLKASSAAGGARGALETMLCVQSDNADLRGAFFEDPGFPSAARFADRAGSKPRTYAAPDAPARVPDVVWDPGEPVPAGYMNGSGVLLRAHGGFLPVPAPDAFGRCSDGAHASFEAPVGPPNSCTIVIAGDDASLARSCGSGGALSLLDRTSKLFVGAQPDAAVAIDGDYLPVRIDSVRFESWGDGAEVPLGAISLDEISSCGSFYTAAADGAGPGGCAIVTDAANSVGANTAACRFALKAVSYTLVHDGSRIVNATAAVRLTDVPRSAAVDGFLSVSREVTVAFASSVPVARTENNIISRVRSGNPGYVFGMPVLAGVLATNGGAQAIAARVPGLRIPGAPHSATCPSGPADYERHTVVRFGVDLKSSCKVDTTAAQLERLCEAGGAPASLGTNDTHVGTFGNADPLDKSAWVAATMSAPSSQTSWSVEERRCRGLVTGVHWRFLWANTGTAANPQPKIVAAERYYSAEDVAWVRAPGAPSTATQPIFLSSTATFIQYDVEEAAYAPPPPPAIFSIPWDSFYPFLVPEE